MITICTVMFLVLMITKVYPTECTLTSFMIYEIGEGIFSGAAVLVKNNIQVFSV